jgi:hypothetical protein
MLIAQCHSGAIGFIEFRGLCGSAGRNDGSKRHAGQCGEEKGAASVHGDCLQ